jgi:hypothetical protein
VIAGSAKEMDEEQDAFLGSNLPILLRRGRFRRQRKGAVAPTDGGVKARQPGRRKSARTRAFYPGPLSDAFGKIIRFCGGAGSRTRVRKCSAHAATCVSGDLVFDIGFAHRRGVPTLSLS